MLITDPIELDELEYVLKFVAARHREYAEKQPPMRANQFRHRADLLEQMYLRMLREHFPKAAESEEKRLGAKPASIQPPVR